MTDDRCLLRVTEDIVLIHGVYVRVTSELGTF